MVANFWENQMIKRKIYLFFITFGFLKLKYLPFFVLTYSEKKKIRDKTFIERVVILYILIPFFMILNKTLEKIFIIVTHVYIFCTKKEYHIYHRITIKKLNISRL